eukprot:GHRR01017951.1.p1 GENE.GHRR01017951.1~~GHRR01017951.1.p1  ORF type:complete len:557 (+),score=208.68 GHRR01017951.1:82-1752(+)
MLCFHLSAAICALLAACFPQAYLVPSLVLLGSINSIAAGWMPMGSIDLLLQAEDQLQRGLVEAAHGSARKALALRAASSDPTALARGYSVLIQAEFQCNRLTDLEKTLRDSGHTTIDQLPVAVILLWGVVAVELQAAAAARATLGKYIATKQGAPSGLSREDAMALSRLYAVQLLSGLCQDFDAAADWLDSGGLGVSPEQRELLLLEVEEAEELLHEQCLAEWASTHAAGAAADNTAGPLPPDSSEHLHPSEQLSAVSEVAGSCVADNMPAVDQACQELGPSASVGSAAGESGPSISYVSCQASVQHITSASAEQPSLAEHCTGTMGTATAPLQATHSLQTEQLPPTTAAVLAVSDSPVASCTSVCWEGPSMQGTGELQQLNVAPLPATATADDNPFCTMTGSLYTIKCTPGADLSSNLGTNSADAAGQHGITSSSSCGSSSSSPGSITQAHAAAVEAAGVEHAATPAGTNSNPAAGALSTASSGARGGGMHTDAAAGQHVPPKASLSKWVITGANNLWSSATVKVGHSGSISCTAAYTTDVLGSSQVACAVIAHA